jgi:PAS domain S-box-containing protein
MRNIVLNVDDHDAGRYARSRVLRRAGFEVLEAGTGAEALELATNRKPQLVLLDVNLPDMTGYEVCRQIKAGGATSHILVVHVSATFVQGADQKRGLEGGADGYLAEPVDPEVLIATVQAFLRLRQTEEALRESEERFRGAFEDAPIGMGLVNADRRIFRSNKSLCQILGYTPEELTDLCEPPIFPIDDLDKGTPLFSQLFGAGASTDRREKQCLSKKGDVLWLSLSGTAIRNFEGDILYGLLMVENITDRKLTEERQKQVLAAEQKARKEAELANRAKDQFLATVSHELRTPLGAILGWARILGTTTTDSRTLVRGLEAIERNANAQAQLIEDILDLSSIISGKLSLNVQTVELAAIIRAAVDSVTPAAQSKSVRLRVNLAQDVGPLTGDPNRLQQVVWNLLSNAVKFTPSDGAVEVRLERVNSHAEITVSDSGQGISADFLPHVFEAFSQEDASTSRKHSGLGLGLAIVRQLVELHGGTIQVYSDGDGQGTTFKAKLPLVAPQASRSGEEPQKAAEPAREFPRLLSRLKVLVVDDALDSRDMLGLILEKAGADVRLASSAKEALKIVESWRPGLLIADIGMPEEDGYALIRQVRALKSQEGGMVPALALTGYASRQDRLQSILAGFQEHMTKPVEPEELIAVAADLVATAKKAGRRF